MSGVLHPVGPEPAQTYWVRRVLVLGAAMMLLVVIFTLVGNIGRGPQAQPAVLPRSTPAATPSSTPSMSTSEKTGSTAIPDAGGAVPSAGTTSSSTASTKPPNAKPSTSAKLVPAQPQPCRSAELRATLTGSQRLKPRQASTFHLSVINGSPQTCVVQVAPQTFELKIYSGTDRIWSTNDCTTLVKPLKAIVESEKAVEWQLTWNGHRSAKNCRNRPETPRAGTYIATAQLAGALPVRLRVILHS